MHGRRVRQCIDKNEGIGERKRERKREREREREKKKKKKRKRKRKRRKYFPNECININDLHIVLILYSTHSYILNILGRANVKTPDTAHSDATSRPQLDTGTMSP